MNLKETVDEASRLQDNPGVTENSDEGQRDNEEIAEGTEDFPFEDLPAAENQDERDFETIMSPRELTIEQIKEILYGFQFYAFNQSDGTTISRGHSIKL